MPSGHTRYAPLRAAAVTIPTMAIPVQNFTEAFVADIPAIVKAVESKDGKRKIEVEASSEELDAEGDIIAQGALLGSADEFIKSGHLDIDHISELGARMGISNPESYIIGRPLEVKDIGGGRTSVVGEIARSRDGIHDPKKNRYDAFWDSLHTDPPVRWRASVYGFPKGNMVDDCRSQVCESGAKRFHIKGMSWRSLALTRNPVNESLTGYAKVVKATAWVEMMKAANLSGPPDIRPFDMQGGEPFTPNNNHGTYKDMAADPMTGTAPMVALSMPRNLMDAIGQWHGHMKSECPHTEGLATTAGFKSHFQICCGMDADTADLYAHALKHKLLLMGRRV